MRQLLAGIVRCMPLHVDFTFHHISKLFMTDDAIFSWCGMFLTHQFWFGGKNDFFREP